MLPQKSLLYLRTYSIRRFDILILNIELDDEEKPNITNFVSKLFLICLIFVL